MPEGRKAPINEKMQRSQVWRFQTQSRASEGSLLGTLDLAEQSTAVVGLDGGTLGRRSGLIDRLDVGELVLTLDLRQEARAVNLLDMNVSYNIAIEEEQVGQEATCVSVYVAAAQNSSDFGLETWSTAA